jgi:5-deoxy-glucuronate isomerase
MRVEYVGFDVWRLKAGESIELPSDKFERCLVLVAPLASVKAAESHFYRIGQRMSPFERTPPVSVRAAPYLRSGDCRDRS